LGQAANNPNHFSNVARKTAKDPTWVTIKNPQTGLLVPKIVERPLVLNDLINKSPKSIITELAKINAIPTESLRFPNGPVLPAVLFFDDVSDFFHDQNREEFQVLCLEVFATLRHKFHIQLLTKRPSNARAFFKKHHCPDNVWVGTTCETTDKDNIGQNYIWDGKKSIPVKGYPANWWGGEGDPPWTRLKILSEIEAPVLFTSAEPMVGRIFQPDSVWKRIDWAIIGFESNNNKPKAPIIRGYDLKDELDDLLAQLARNHVQTWFKQWGSYDAAGNYLGGHAKAGHSIKGREKFLWQWPKYYLNVQKKGY
jgi:protein gp37